MRRVPLPALLCVLLAGCGYVGEPLPPALNIPETVKDLSAQERGGRIIVEFTLPERTTDNTAIRGFSEIELRAGSLGGRAWNREQWLTASRSLTVPANAAERVRVETPAGPWVGQEVIFGVRTANRKGRFSDWSNFFSLAVIQPLEAPHRLEATGVPEGVRVSWQDDQNAAGLAFLVLRKTAGQEQPAEAARVTDRQWTDRETEYGKTYEYSVQAVAPAGEHEARGELAGPVSIAPKDVFPPAVPAGLTAIAGVNTIELAWDRNTETDLRAYHVYRATGDGPFEKIADPETPAYSDREVKSGTRYRYVVSASDQSGNESGKPAAVEMTAP